MVPQPQISGFHLQVPNSPHKPGIPKSWKPLFPHTIHPKITWIQPRAAFVTRDINNAQVAAEGKRRV